MNAIAKDIDWQGVEQSPNSLFTDLSPYLDESLQQETPTVAEVWTGQCIFYAGRLNEVHAEPATGKSNVLVAACIQVLEKGGKVLYIDPEDTPAGFVRKVRLFGVDPDLIRDGVHYLHNPSPEQIIQAQDWTEENHPIIVILDGLAESMAAQGLNEDKAGDVLSFFRLNLRPFAEAGSAVVIADHVTKSRENRGMFARGSGAKAGRYDGVSYEIVGGKAYTPTQEGFVKLKVQKDRVGGIGSRGQVIAEVHFTPNANGGTIVAFREPKEKQEGEFKPTIYMEKVVKHLEINAGATTTDLRGIGGQTNMITMAIRCLKEDGVIGVRREGRKMIHFLEKEKAA